MNIIGDIPTNTDDAEESTYASSPVVLIITDIPFETPITSATPTISAAPSKKAFTISTSFIL